MGTAAASVKAAATVRQHQSPLLTACLKHHLGCLSLDLVEYNEQGIYVKADKEAPLAQDRRIREICEEQAQQEERARSAGRKRGGEQEGK